MIERALRLEPDPAEVRVVLETRHGLLVEALLDAGFTVVPVNPDLVARRRGPARKKDDAEDARICCLLALDRHAALKTLIPHGELGGELRAIGRDDERAARDQRRLLNRLRADLQTTYPAALVLAGKDLGAPTVLRLLQRWPTQPSWPRPPARSWSRSPAPGATAGPTGSPTASRPRSPRRRCRPGTTWCGPRPPGSGWPRSSCWRCTRPAAAGSPGWPSCCWAGPAPAGTTP